MDALRLPAAIWILVIGGCLWSGAASASEDEEASGPERSRERGGEAGSPEEKSGGSDDGSSSPDGDSESEMESRLDALDAEVEESAGDSDQSAGDGENSDESIESQVSELESDLEGGSGSGSGGGADRSESALNPKLSVILDSGVTWQQNSPTLVGGPDPEKSFGPFLQSVELALTADVDPFFTFESHLVTDLSGLKVGEAYGTTLALPAGFQSRFGKFKTRFGRVNPRHLHAWRFTALPMVNGKFFGPAGLNGLGVEISQILPLPWYVEWVAAVQDLSSPKTGRAFLRDPKQVDGPLDLVASARIEQFFDIGRDWDLLWGWNGAFGRNDGPGSTEEDRSVSEIYGTDLFVKYKPAAKGGRSELGWQTEALLRRRGSEGDTLVDAGGYSYLYWRPNRTWELGGRYEFVSGPLEAERDYSRPNWLEARQRAGIAGSFFPSNFSMFRLEYMTGGYRNGFDQLAHTVLLKAKLVTGAHGAHKF